MAVALFVTGAVCNFAWLSEDCFITLRYVSNTLSGYGPVFNVGEHVQGYTHPLWFVLLLAGSLIFRNPMLVAYGYCFLFTWLTVCWVGRVTLRACPSFFPGACLLSLTSLVWVFSDPWVSFQSGGLENSLAHLLIVGIVFETWVWSASRAGRLMLLLSLLCLTRPDYVVWAAPLAILLLARVRSARQLAILALAIVPVLAWLLFAAVFYHDIIPNTFYAKVGIYPSLADAVAQGLAYLGDWLHYDALAAGGTFLFLGLAAWRARTRPRIALLAGIVLYLIWILQVGGDFMRGRLFMSVLTAAMFAGSLALAEQMRAFSRALAVELAGIGAVLAILFVAKLWIPEPPIDPLKMVIVNERKYFPGYSLEYVLEHGRLENPDVDLNLADKFRDYTQKCGPITIHMLTPGTFGYLAGPNVSIIDLLGLTDAFVAKLPRENLVVKIPRPGHPKKYIPVSYLISRKDVALLPHWVDSLVDGDCSLPSQVESLQRSGDSLVFPK